MGKRTEFLFLNEEEMIEAGVLDSARCEIGRASCRERVLRLV